MPPCLTLSIIRYGSRVKWSNPGKGVAPSPTPWCSKLSKREPSGHPPLWSPTLLIYKYSFCLHTVKCQTIQFSISTQFSSNGPIDRALLGATTPGQSGPGSNNNEGVLHIPQSSRITGTSPSDCVVSYTGYLGESYLSTEKQSVYSTTPAQLGQS